MALVVWGEKWSVGIASIDQQHKKLIALLNQLHDGMVAGKGKDVLIDILRGLIDYTRTHFKYEEELFARTGYAEAAAHKEQHTELVQRVIELQQKYNMSGPDALTIPMMNVLKDWLINHIQGCDKRYIAHFTAKGVR